MIEVSLRVPEESDLGDVVRRVEQAGVPARNVDVLTRVPLPEDTVPLPKSRMSTVGVIGAVFGFSGAVAGLIAITLDAHLRTGGMPMIAPLPLGVITYEMTLLASILAIVGALLLGARLGPRRRVAHHPELQYGEAIVSVACTDIGQAERVRDALAAWAGAARAVIPIVLLMLASALVTRPAEAQVFQRECAPCHGSHGEGRIGPQIAGRTFIADSIVAQVRHGGLLMPAFPQSEISEAELQALVAYVDSLPTPTSAEMLPAPSPKVAGASVFLTNCMGCHGLDARGAVGPGILNTALTLPQFMQQVRNGGGIMPPFTEKQVSDSAARAVYAYLHPTLARADPGTVDALPAVTNYTADSLFVFAALALLAQVASERRRRRMRRVEEEAKVVRTRFPEPEGGALQVRAF